MILAFPESGGIRIRDTSWPRGTNDCIYAIYRNLWDDRPPEENVHRKYNVPLSAVRIVKTLKELEGR